MKKQLLIILNTITNKRVYYIGLSLLLGIAIWGTQQIVSIPPAAHAQADFSCANVSEIPQDECEALVAIYNANDNGNSNWGNWLTTNEPCGWRDVDCVDGRVTRLSLIERGLTTLPAEIGNLSSLTELNVGDNQLRSLPSEIGNLSSLTKLYVWENNLAFLPSTIGNLSSLESFSAVRNILRRLPSAIGNLSSLTSLNLNENQLTSLPPEIGNLSSLTELEVARNPLTSLPPEIGNLSSLTTLSVDESQLTSLPSEIGNLSSLTELGISDNQLTSLPPEIGNLSSLTYFNMWRNQLTSLPLEISNLSSLTYFNMHGNQLTSLPSEIGNLSSLELLSVSKNQLTSLPPEIGNLSSLTTLSMYNNQLTRLPPEIGNLSFLRELRVGGNLLTSLLPEIGNLSSLTNLNARGNRLTSLPPEIGSLSSLYRLDLSENQLTSLLPEIGNLSSLIGLDVSENQLTSLPPEIGNITALRQINTSGNPSIIQPMEIAILLSPSQQGGTVERSLPGPYYAQGSSFQLTAVPASGWRFDYWDSWGGRTTDATISVTIAPERPAAYVAHFVEADAQSILGNVDCDDDLDVVDALFTLQYVVGQRSDHGSCPLADETTQLYAAAADLDGNGQIDVLDALFILQCAAGVSNGYCGLNAASAQEDRSQSSESNSVVGTVDVSVQQTEQTIRVQIDSTTVSPAAGTFELIYDSSRARLTNCEVAGQGTCHERADGTIHFAFIDSAGLKGVQPIAELTFDNADVTLIEIAALTLADGSGRNLAAEVMVRQDRLEQNKSEQVDGSAIKMFIPLINR